MALIHNALKETNRKERELIIEFLYQSADKLLGYGMIPNKGYDLKAIHWMSEGMELAAEAIERGEHLEPDH